MPRLQGNPKWTKYATQLTKASERLKDAQDELAALQREMARTYVRIEKARQTIAEIAKTPPGTFPNNMDNTGR